MIEVILSYFFWRKIFVAQILFQFKGNFNLTMYTLILVLVEIIYIEDFNLLLYNDHN